MDIRFRKQEQQQATVKPAFVPLQVSSKEYRSRLYKQLCEE